MYVEEDPFTYRSAEGLIARVQVKVLVLVYGRLKCMSYPLWLTP